jgi:hypothetical protein
MEYQTPQQVARNRGCLVLVMVAFLAIGAATNESTIFSGFMFLGAVACFWILVESSSD